jgi:CrcB protein
VAVDKLLLIAVLGAVGSLVRVHLGGYVHNAGNRSLPPERYFPYGTQFVNVLGSFLLGVVIGSGMSGDLPPLWVAAFGTGFCGALTTFSTWAVDLQRGLRAGRYGAATTNLLLSVLLGTAAAWAGFVLCR